MKHIILILAAVLPLLVSCSGGETPAQPPRGPIIVGYATSWESTMPDPSLLTHINYAFGKVQDDFESLYIENPEKLLAVVALKESHPEIKVSLSIGGWTAGNFSEMAADPQHRKHFCQECLDAVKKYGLDGIDMDWEYPTSSEAGISSSPDDTENFTLLLKELREVLGTERLLTMASKDDAKYVHWESALPYLNFVNIMAYDTSRPPYHNAGLYKSPLTRFTCDEAVTMHISAGVPREKLVLGIPLYGHGDSKAYPDYVDFKNIDPGSWTSVWDDEAKVPYLAGPDGTMVFSYEDARSAALKAEYILEKGLLGAMYWNIEADDAGWTLSRAIHDALMK